MEHKEMYGNVLRVKVRTLIKFSTIKNKQTKQLKRDRKNDPEIIAE
jgi:hypothetical protein